MFRIRSLKTLGTVGSQPILLMHGFTSSSDTWIKDSDECFPFRLANEGFDVWLGNNRGNKYSRRHTTLKPSTDPEKYFHYSFVELARFDLPPMIELMRMVTGFQKVGYMGHSQGNT